ncbi:DnaD and phage-associated domain-containing protein [Streptococcus henryi]|uniref:DnaD and phage-associated domain-containing protein n=1 Tax=Streptococcus henryi TaxID=439219 RepID=A0A1G6AKK0_9STRE|nr:DnaD domain protein [Streptococcus henryi]QBX25342.1 DNA replication protein [Streptococcus phage Javan252]SDB08947.1 DnaD and phage-associated domain-containing protein [Streptococcus henryi]
MAQKRMFNISITDTDKFLDMPATSQNLYFHLNMHADDDGFVDSPKRIMRNVNASQDDMNILLSKQFVFVFDTGVMVIRDWKIHNIIRKDTYKPTLYQEEKSMLEITETGAYRVRNEPVTRAGENVAQIRLDKNRIDKDRIEEVKEEKISTSSQNSQNIKYFFEKWQEITGRALTPFEIEDIPKLHKEDDFSIELMLAALKEAANSTSNFNFNYFKSILMRYKRQGLLTPEMVAGAERQRQESKNRQFANQQPVPEWANKEYKREATEEEKKELKKLLEGMED